MDTTWSVKVDDEFKQKLTDLAAQSGKNNKEFIGHLVGLYELERLKEKPLVCEDINELQGIVDRLMAIYKNIGERVQSTLAAKDLEFAELIKSRDKNIEMLQSAVEDGKVAVCESKEAYEIIKEQNEKLNADMVNLGNQYSSAVYQHEKVNQTNEALIAEYKEKNDTLAGLLSEYKAYKEDNIALQTEIANIKAENTRILNINGDLETQISSLQQEVKLKEKDYMATLAKAENECKANIEAIKERLLLEKEKALLDLDKKLNDEYNQKVRELQAEHSNQLKELMTVKPEKRINAKN